LYMRDTARGETVKLDVQQPGVPNGGTPYAEFQIASEDGSRVFFTDADQEQRLTPNSGSQGYDMYECEIVEEAGKPKCRTSCSGPAKTRPTCISSPTEFWGTAPNRVRRRGRARPTRRRVLRATCTCTTTARSGSSPHCPMTTKTTGPNRTTTPASSAG